MAILHNSPPVEVDLQPLVVGAGPVQDTGVGGWIVNDGDDGVSAPVNGE